MARRNLNARSRRMELRNAERALNNAKNNKDEKAIQAALARIQSTKKD